MPDEQSMQAMEPTRALQPSGQESAPNAFEVAGRSRRGVN
jgi:hypothetical protein